MCTPRIPYIFEKNTFMVIYYQKEITVLSKGRFRNMVVNIKFGHCEPTTAHFPIANMHLITQNAQRALLKYLGSPVNFGCYPF